MKSLITYFLVVIVTLQPLYARIERGGGGNRIAVQNHSTGASHNANVNRNYNQNANVNRNYNQNTNVNRNVNVNQNVNVNRNVNVDVHGGYYGGCCYHEDNNWGAFAAGAAVGVATTAVVAAATRPQQTTTVVTNTVAVGSVVPTLPGECATVASGSAVLYQCSNVYYRPYYQGSTLVYQVVTYP
jgi:hypothetical protein